MADAGPWVERARALGALIRACADAGLTFVGPRPEILDLLGDKAQARALASTLEVPVLPGVNGAASFEHVDRRRGEVIVLIGFRLLLQSADEPLKLFLADCTEAISPLGIVELNHQALSISDMSGVRLTLWA